MICKVIEDMRKEERVEVVLPMVKAEKCDLEEINNISRLPLERIKQLRMGRKIRILYFYKYSGSPGERLPLLLCH